MLHQGVITPWLDEYFNGNEQHCETKKAEH